MVQKAQPRDALAHAQASVESGATSRPDGERTSTAVSGVVGGQRRRRPERRAQVSRWQPSAEEIFARLSPARRVAEVREVARATVLTVHGELDSFTACELRRSVEQVADRGGERVVIDLRDVAFMDGSGLGTLVHATERLSRLGRDVVLRDPPAHATRILDLSGLAEIFTIER